MPQMAPIFWLSLLFFFLLILMLFLMLNYFIKPFNVFSSYYSTHSTPNSSWKL